MSAPPLLSQATASQPVETGSDWEIPSRFSFQPMAPRKVWTGVTPTSALRLAALLTETSKLASYWRSDLSVCFNSLKRPRQYSARREKGGQTPVQSGLLHDSAYQNRE